MRPRARRFFRGLIKFVKNIVQTRRELNNQRQYQEPCTACGNPRTLPTVDGGWTCAACEDGYR